ncbi:integral membrane protein [Devosia sp. DBB001]|nr:integral membrane protein [Devosia sp. DBB001]
MSPRPHNIPLGILAGIGAGALWGGVFLLPKVLPEFSPFELTVGRYLIYGLVSLLLLAPQWRRIARVVTSADWAALVRLSMLGNIVYYVFLVEAIHLGGIAIASLIVGLIPVVVTLVGSRDQGAMSLRSLTGPLLVIGVGMVLINYDLFAVEQGGLDPWMKLIGVGCAVAALACWSAYAVGNARWLGKVHDISSQDWSLLTGLVTGALAVILAIPVFMLSPGHEGPVWMNFWIGNAVIAIGASVVANGLWNAASRLLPLTLSGQMIIFETLFALLYGFLFEQRLPRPLEMLAIAALIIGVTWSARLHQDHAAQHQ